LIAPGIILSAAHCAGNIRTARIGSNKANSGGVVKSVTTECVHPNYQSFTTTNDYMLLKLNSPVDINQYPPIQLNNNKAVPKANQILTVIGFGTTSEGGFVSNTLLKVNVPANSHQQCNQQYAGSIVESVMFCAGELSGGKDSCQGDSGGPIFEIRSGKAVQVGIVSFGEGCARPNRSGVYSRISGAYDWIQTTMAKLNNGDTSGCRGGKPSTPTKPPVNVPTRKPIKYPTKRPTKPPTESPSETPFAPVRPPTSPTSMGVPFGESPSDDDDDDFGDDDDFFGIGGIVKDSKDKKDYVKYQ
jgi:secreted trypsin-like serine protease